MRCISPAAAAATLLVAALFSVAGCNSKPETTPAPASVDTPRTSGRKINVYLLPKKKGVAYFSSCAQGAQKAARSRVHRALPAVLRGLGAGSSDYASRPGPPSTAASSAGRLSSPYSQ